MVKDQEFPDWSNLEWIIQGTICHYLYQLLQQNELMVHPPHPRLVGAPSFSPMPIYRSSELLQAQQNALAAAEGPDGSKASDAQAPDKKVGVSPLLCFFFFFYNPVLF